MWLTDEQVAELTKAKRVSKQVEVLARAGVPFKIVAGRPIVLLSALEPSLEDAPRPQVRHLPRDKRKRGRK